MLYKNNLHLYENDELKKGENNSIFFTAQIL